MKTLFLKILKSPTFWRIAIVAILAAVAFLAVKRVLAQREEIERLQANEAALLGDLEHYTDENGELHASVMALTMRSAEFEALIPKYEADIKALKIRARDLEHVAQVATQTLAEFTADVRVDTVYVRPDQPPVITRQFEWSDEWVSVAGRINDDKVACSVQGVDSLTLIAYRRPRGWWIFKCKGKIVKYDVKSANPHTTIGAVEYVEIME